MRYRIKFERVREQRGREELSRTLDTERMRIENVKMREFLEGYAVLACETRCGCCNCHARHLLEEMSGAPKAKPSGAEAALPAFLRDLEKRRLEIRRVEEHFVGGIGGSGDWVEIDMVGRYDDIPIKGSGDWVLVSCKFEDAFLRTVFKHVPF